MDPDATIVPLARTNLRRIAQGNDVVVDASGIQLRREGDVQMYTAANLAAALRAGPADEIADVELDRALAHVRRDAS